MSTTKLSTAKIWLGLDSDNTEEDLPLQGVLDAIEQDVAEYLSMTWDEETVTEDLAGRNTQYIWPSKHPITAITSITDVESNITWSNFEWREGGADTPDSGKLWLTDGTWWPVGIYTRRNIRVVYTASYDGYTAGQKAAIAAVVRDLFVLRYHTKGNQASGTSAGVAAVFRLGKDDDPALNIMRRLIPYRFGVPV